MTDFAKWMVAMGLTRKQVSEAGAMIGLNSTGSVYETLSGKRRLKETERLAMSALRAGLKPWTPEYDCELQELASGERPANAA